MRDMMLTPITIDDICYAYAMKNERRRRRKCAYDDDSNWQGVTRKKRGPRKKLKIPTDSEQSEFLKIAIEKGLRGQKRKIPHIKQRVLEHRHLFSRYDQCKL